MKRNPRPQNVEIVGHALRTVNKVCRTETTLRRAASYYGRIVPSRLVSCVIKATGSLVNQLTRSRVFSVPSVEGSVMSLPKPGARDLRLRSEEHTSELQSHLNLVCRLLLEKK